MKITGGALDSTGRGARGCARGGGGKWVARPTLFWAEIWQLFFSSWGEIGREGARGGARGRKGGGGVDVSRITGPLTRAACW